MRTILAADLLRAIEAYRSGCSMEKAWKLSGAPRDMFRAELRRLGIARGRGDHMVGKRRDKHPCWKGGRYIDMEGYVWVQARDHPWPRANGYIREHIRIVECALGRRLQRNEVVHHRNGIKTDNRPENLELQWADTHSRAHALQDVPRLERDEGGRFAGRRA